MKSERKGGEGRQMETKTIRKQKQGRTKNGEFLDGMCDQCRGEGATGRGVERVGVRESEGGRKVAERERGEWKGQYQGKFLRKRANRCLKLRKVRKNGEEREQRGRRDKGKGMCVCMCVCMCMHASVCGRCVCVEGGRERYTIDTMFYQVGYL